MTSYLGLRTAGNFSMFSNLRTEGPGSNHLLLGANPLKRGHYQEDAVHILAIDDERARIGHRYQTGAAGRPIGPFRGQLWRMGPSDPFRVVKTLLRSAPSALRGKVIPA